MDGFREEAERLVRKHLEDWFGERIENIEDPGINKFLFKPLYEGVAKSLQKAFEEGSK